MRWRLTAVVSWMVVLVAVAAPAAGPAAERRAPLDLAATVARLDALTISITGDLAELRASEVLNYHRVVGGTARCMRAHGRPFRKPPFVDFYRDFTDADLGYGNGRATIIDSLTAGTRRFELNDHAFARLARAGVYDTGVRPEDVDVLNGCTAPFDHRPYVGADLPAGAYALTTFEDLLAPVYQDPAVAAAWRRYDACMKDRHGYVVGADRSDFLFKPRATDAPGSETWRRGLAEMRAVFAADVDCRRPAYVAAMRVVAQRLDAWERKHRPELLSIRREWRGRVAAAANLPR